MLSNKRVQSYRAIREEEAALVVKKIGEASGNTAVDLSAMFESFSNDVVGRSAFGAKLRDSENGRKFLDAMADLMELLGIIDIGDFIPWLGWIGRVNGFDRRLDNTAKKLDQVLESVIQERMGVKDTNTEYFVDILLDIYDHKTADASHRDSVKAIILMELLLAHLVRKFDWKLANGVEPKDLDMSESPGVTIHRAVPLLALASPAP
ncbi:hypothetical protein SASPL_121779 [Salvia splendens]|uniref:Uncharacterized protein n=1 Tax=Salvia splendens TaxID=180675 RepID=A0A8X8XVM8_SALSN|nr:hypothetical protein SASPL_121779 [Salvia splendens]